MARKTDNSNPHQPQTALELLLHEHLNTLRVKGHSEYTVRNRRVAQTIRCGGWPTLSPAFWAGGPGNPELNTKGCPSIRAKALSRAHLF